MPQKHIKKLFVGTFSLSSGKAGEQILRILNTYVAARWAGAHDYGLFVLATAIIQFARILSFIGLQSGIVKFIGEYEVKGETQKLKTFLKFAFLVVITLSLVFSLIIFFWGGNSLSRFLKKPGLQFPLKALALFLPILTLSEIFKAISLARTQYLSWTIIHLSQHFLRLIFTVILVALLGLKLRGLVGSTIFAWGLSATLGFLLLRSYLNKRFSIKESIKKYGETRKWISFSLPLALGFSLDVIMRRIDVFMLGMFLSAGMVGIYNVAQRVAGILQIPVFAIQKSVMPIYAQEFAVDDKYAAKSVHQFITKWFIIVSIPILALLGYFGKTILGTVGKEFATGMYAFLVLLLNQFIQISFGPLSSVITMSGYTQLNLANSVVSVITNVLLNLILIPRFGILGAALAVTLSYIILSTVITLEVYYLFRFLPWKVYDLLSIPIGLSVFGIPLIFLQNKSVIFFIALIIYGGFVVKFLMDKKERVLFSKIYSKALRKIPL